MAGIIVYMAPVDRASGKILGKSQRWSAVNRDWGNRQRGCSARYKDRNYSTNPLTPDEQAQRAAFTAAAALRKLILDNAALRATWLKRLQDDKKAGSTKCSTLNGYLMNQAMNGHISEAGQYQE